MDALFTRGAGLETRLLGTDAHSGQVGAFEGADYEAKGLLPPPGRLHHVHAGHDVLRGLPARDRANHLALLAG